MSSATRRSLLDLPLDVGHSVIDQWQGHTAKLQEQLDLPSLPLRLFLDRGSRFPREIARVRGVDLRIEEDPQPFRGTGGVLRDIASEYDPDDVLVVANAAQVLLEPLPDLVTTMAATGGDVCVVSHADGTASGLLLVRCRCLEVIPDRGFVDLKEQGLRRMSRAFRGSVVYRDLPSGLPVRELHGYIAALSWYHRRRAGATIVNSPWEEDWSPSFSIVEQGAYVDPRVQLHDSVVLRGGRVEGRAFVVRSIVCPGGVIKRRTVMNQLVS